MSTKRGPYKVRMPDPLKVKWQRCKETCGCNRNPSRFDNCACRSLSPSGNYVGGCERDALGRRQRTIYATHISQTITGYASEDDFKCPMCFDVIPFWYANVDKTGSLYLPRAIRDNGTVQDATVCLVCARCNNERSKLQQHQNGDLPNVQKYLDDIQQASLSVSVLPPSKCKPKRMGNAFHVKPTDTLLGLLQGPYM